MSEYKIKYLKILREQYNKGNVGESIDVRSVWSVVRKVFLTYSEIFY
jgi:hypothetical protein